MTRIVEFMVSRGKSKIAFEYVNQYSRFDNMLAGWFVLNVL